MKRRLFLLLLLLWGSPGATGAAEIEIIENHSFGVFTAAEGKVLLLLQNEECVATYKVSGIGPIVGKGKVDFRNQPRELHIPLADNFLRVLCITGNRLRVVTR